MPDFALEQQLIAQGFSHIAGIDEAGRGPLAGPVVAAAVILDAANIPEGLNDSKKLSARRRVQLFDQIVAHSYVSIASAPPKIIATRNIRGATLWAMRQAALGLAFTPDHCLVDGRDVPPLLPSPAQAVIKGDSISLSIAAASIVAKVTRDRMCATLEQAQPDYGFAQHKGYGTALHLTALTKFGASPHHRAGFGPVTRALGLD